MRGASLCLTVLVAVTGSGCGDDAPRPAPTTAADCASFTPRQDLWVDDTKQGAAHATKADVIAEGQRIVDCKVVIGKTEAEIASLLGASAVRPEDLGGAPGDDFRLWRWGEGPALYVTFASGKAIKAELTHPECDKDISDPADCGTES